MINETLTKTDLKKIKSIIKKELRNYEKNDLNKKVKSIVKKDFKKIEDLDPDFEKKIENITKEVLQAFHNLLYREPYIINKKVNRR